MKKIKTEPIKTVLTITVGFVVVYLITQAKWAVVTATVIGVAGLISSYVAVKIDSLWMKLAWVMSLIMPRIILSIIFYLFLFPISVIARIFRGKDTLHLKNNQSSTYKVCDEVIDKRSFEVPW